MAVKIDKKIVGYAVVKEDPNGKPTFEVTHPPCQHSTAEGCAKPFKPLSLPDSLPAKRYRLRSPIHSGSLYMFVVDAEVDGQLRPVEVFFEAKSMESYPWIKFNARLISALLRQPGKFPAFIIDVMIQTKAPNGNYFIPGGGGQVESIVHHAGEVLKQHCVALGLIAGKPILDAAQKEYVEKKKEELGVDGSSYPDYAASCPKCHEKAVIQLDGCSVCLACSDSKCS